LTKQWQKEMKSNLTLYMVFDIEPSIGIASAGKVHFRKMLSVTLTSEPTTLNIMSLVSRGPGNE